MPDIQPTQDPNVAKQTTSAPMQIVQLPNGDKAQFPGDMAPEKIEQKVQTAASPFENARQNILNGLFSDRDDSIRIPKIDPETGQAYTTSEAAGTEILKEAGFHNQELANAIKVVTPYLALATASAVNQMASENRQGFTENMDEGDPASEVNAINSIASFFVNGFIPSAIDSSSK